MEIKQQLTMTQQLVMTPQLQLAIKLLQMSRMELADVLREEMTENPVLEDIRDGMELSSREVAAANTSAESGDRSAGSSDDRSSGDDNRDDFDVQTFLERHAQQGSIPSGVRPGGDDELPNYEATLSRSDDLVDHLIWQVRMSDLVEDEQRFAALVIGNLNEAGLLTLDGVDPDDVVPKLADEAGLHPEDAEEVLKILQKMDPVGVATRTLSECLRVQAEHFGADELVFKVIDNHLEDLEKKSYAHIARVLKVHVNQVHDIAQYIADLEPRPGRNFITEEPRYIVPDVHIYKVDDEYIVSANDDGMPKLKISGYYRSAAADDPRAKEYIQSKLRSAQWLIRSIDQRRRTIVKVTECIVEKQKDFFDKGITHLKPMILRDVAEAVGMHESTISRVTSNKWVSTPRGVFELKHFFNSAIRRDNNEDIASAAVKHAIKELIGKENPKKPLSDQKIVEILMQQDIHIARRTVAKYREMMGILSSSKRKKVF